MMVFKIYNKQYKFKKLALKRNIKFIKTKKSTKYKNNWIQTNIVLLPRSILNLNKEKSILKKIYKFKNAIKENYCQKPELNW